MFAGICAVAAGLLRWPTETMAAAKEGLTLCANVIVPSLFPFFVLASLVVELGLARQLGRMLEPVMRPLFHVSGPGAAAVVLGAIGGYPVGARTAISLYRENLCSKAETQRLLAFCNNSGPAFILGVVGAGIFESSRVGLLLYLCHIAASLTVGLLFRFYGPKNEPKPHPSPAHSPLNAGQTTPPTAFPPATTHKATFSPPLPRENQRKTTDSTALSRENARKTMDSTVISRENAGKTTESAALSRENTRKVCAKCGQTRAKPAPSAGSPLAAFPSAVIGAFTSVLNITAFVLFFSVFTKIISLFGLFEHLSALLPLPADTLRPLLAGLLELTSGVTALTGGATAARVTLAAFMLGWAGVSIHVQVLSFLADTGLSPRSYFLGKLLHGGISAVYTYVLARILPLDAPVSALLGEQVLFLSDLNFARTLAFSLLLCCGIFLFFALWGRKKAEPVLK